MKKLLFVLFTISLIAFGSTAINQTERNIKGFDNYGLSHAITVNDFDDEDFPRNVSI